MHVVPAPQQLSAWPQPSDWPHPPPGKSAHVLGVQLWHALFWHVSPDGQGEHTLVTPHPKLTGPHPVTSPASIASAHALGAQHPPSTHVSPDGHVPQETVGPHPLFKLPQTAPPHTGAEQLVHCPATHLFVPVQAPQDTLALPHAFKTEPHSMPPSALHSGGAEAQSPFWHVCPAGQPHDFVFPH
jgi:hypothetical protein